MTEDFSFLEKILPPPIFRQIFIFGIFEYFCFWVSFCSLFSIIWVVFEYQYHLGRFRVSFGPFLSIILVVFEHPPKFYEIRNKNPPPLHFQDFEIFKRSKRSKGWFLFSTSVIYSALNRIFQKSDLAIAIYSFPKPKKILIFPENIYCLSASRISKINTTFFYHTPCT